MGKQLRKSELETTQQTIKFFETLLRASTDGIVITDAAQNIVLVNEAFCVLLGQRRRDVIETNLFVWLDQLDANGPRRWAELERRIRLEGACRDVEFQMQSPVRSAAPRDAGDKPVEGAPKGEVRHLSVNASPLEQMADEESGVIISIWRDVTERVRAESHRDATLEALRESEERYRGVAEDTPVLICRFLPAGEITFVNKTYCEYFARTPEELVGSTFLSLIPQADRETVMANISALTVESPAQSHEHRVITPDGDVRWQRWTNRALFDAPGKIVVYQSIGEDITERKRAEEELMKSERRFRSILDNSLDAVYKLNLETSTYDFASPSCEQVMGYTPDEFISWGVKGTISLMHPGDIERLAEHFDKLTANSATIEENISPVIEYRFKHKKLGYRWMSDTRTVIFDDANNPTAIIGSVRDVTERKQIEDEIRLLNAELEQRVIERTAQLETTNRELEAFAYSVSHDLRAPLRSIDGFSQALLEDYTRDLDAEGQDYLQRVRKASQRMGQLIDDLLKLSRLTRGEMRREIVDLSALAQTITSDLQNTQPEHRTECLITPDLSATGDAHLLRVVLENLLGNAWKFTSKRTQARIEFGVTELEGESAYFVRDNGAGFDMAYADKLFDAFQRLHRMTEFPGTGIGLATVQRIIHRHGGRVWAEGAVEQGATFYFVL